MLYLDGMKIAPIAKQLGVSRQTLTVWKKEGFPIEITGGKTWEEFREFDRAETMQVYQAKAAERATESSLEFFETAKKDVMALFEVARGRLMDGEGVLNFSDVDKLLNVYIRLDNQAADRVLWMQDIMRKLFSVVVGRVKDERIVLQIRSDLMGLAAGEQRKMGSLPGQSELPTPAEMVMGEKVTDESENSDRQLIIPRDHSSHPDQPPSLQPPNPLTVSPTEKLRDA